MKTRILCSLVFLLQVYVCHAQQQRSLHPWGTWGHGVLNKDKDLDIYNGYGIQGYNVNIDWSQIEPQKGQYNWEVVDNALNILMNRNLWVGFLFYFGKSCPGWLYNTVPKVTTSGGADDGPYPYYFDPDYEKAYFNILKKIVNRLNSYPNETKSFIAYWQIAEGSTGDTDPYKGNPTNSKYNISGSDWTKFRKRVWDSLAVYQQGKKTYKNLYNGGNSSQDIDYIENKFPRQMNKDGNLSHKYSFDGELAYFGTRLTFGGPTPEVLFSGRSRGEIQNIWNFDWWEEAPLKQTFTLVCSALAGGLDMFNIPTGYINKNTKDKRPTLFFNDYAGWTTGRFTNKGFIALRDVIDFADATRFPENEYGPVIDPKRENEFNKQINNINNSNNGESYKWWQKSQTVAKYINPARKNELIDKFKGQGAMYNDNDDSYHKDFGVLLARNYSKFIYQVDASSTSNGRWRLGPANDLYGRYAREFKIKNGAGEMYFKVGDSLLNIGGPNYQLKFTVVYFDDGTGKWSITNGSNASFKTTNTNTKKWIEKTVTFDNFQKGQLKNGEADFSLRYLNGDNTPFTLITVENLEKGEPSLASSSTDALVPNALSSGARLGQNYPNPVTNSTSIQYKIPAGTKNAELILRDNTGTARKKIVLNAGEGILNMDSYSLESGVYNYTLYLDGKLVESKKMVVAR